ncbi:CheW protein [Nitrosospira sp. Nsp5]|uniref:CheW protein n=1 Tax=Nitrosospira multiformis TaxID=1231 RepID=A0ABY0TKZ4_9PROT|nr:MULTISPECIES: chemotaxis protein CheW [Nitrosospira]PTR05313.1 CheW protein [Nitrosospira sp. Nsp5]SDQ91001.1 CheW protein [Nitrosospira multiformis]
MSQEKRKPAPVNFREIEQRLATARTTIERIWAPTTEETQRILRARALALAQESTLDETLDEDIEVMEFTLAYEQYAIETRYVRQVAALENLTPLPCTPAFLLGIVNLRGAILPVIDLRKLFELPERGLTDLHRIIVLQSGKILFGILADTVTSVRRILLADLQPSLPTLTGVRRTYLAGITPERLVVLDAEKLLMDESINVQDQVAE